MLRELLLHRGWLAFSGPRRFPAPETEIDRSAAARRRDYAQALAELAAVRTRH